MRVGIGYDVHALVEGRPLILGGVVIPCQQGLQGHSDADVLIHAIMDALLGALALGDLGQHFPDNDASYRGISSLILLQRVLNLVQAEGYQVINLDTVIVAQNPKMASHIDGMRDNIASILGVPRKAVSIKATTTEYLGFEGRGEGISAQAIVNLGKVEESSIDKSST